MTRALPIIDYAQKEHARMVVGRRGQAPGEFYWPRGIAVMPGNEIAVADSSNNRIQMFNSRGTLIGSFGDYGSEKGQFDG
jgi:DNA-binding beta-propeller fold protein YncE